MRRCARMTALFGLMGWLGFGLGGCPPATPTSTPVPGAPSGEVLANHLSRGAVRCGAHMGGTASGQGGPSAPVLIRHQHHMGGSFRLLSLRYALNGQALCRVGEEDGRLLETGARALTVFRGRLPAGGYEILQDAFYRGQGFGVFAYLRKYKFRVRGGGRFTVRAGQPLCVDVYSLERKGATRPLKERPHVRMRLEPNCAALQGARAPNITIPPPAPSPPRKKIRRPGA